MNPETLRTWVREHGRQDGLLPVDERARLKKIERRVGELSDFLALFSLYVADERDDNRNTASNSDFAYERAALRAFAERSANARGRSAPVTP